MKKKSYAVGYCKPPRHSRFKPGQSGNPKGRPKAARGFGAELAEELQKTVKVKENGIVRKISKSRFMVKSQVNKAMSGDTRAFQLLCMYAEALRQETSFEDDDLAEIDELILEQSYRRRKERDDNGSST